MRTVKIPDCMNPFVVVVNHVEYAYPAGATMEVPDDVANVIEHHQAYHDFIEKSNNGETNPGGDAADVAFLDLKKTVTEYRDDTVVKLPECAFCGCTNLKMVVLPKVTNTHGQELFEDCPNLAVVDFTSLTCLARASNLIDDICWIEEYSNPIPKNVKAVINRGGLFQIGATFEEGYGVDFSGFVYTDAYVYIPREYIAEENFVMNEDAYEWPNGYDWETLWNQNRIRAIEDYTVDGTVTGALDLAKMGIE